MTVRTSAGTTLRVSSAQPATFNVAGYNTLFTASPVPALVGEITDLGEFGRDYALVTHNPVGTRGTQKFKASFNEGTMALQLGLDIAHAGQLGRDVAEGPFVIEEALPAEHAFPERS